MNIINSAKEIQSSLQNIRRELHQYPEISRNEKRTSELIIRELKKLGNFEIKENIKI